VRRVLVTAVAGLVLCGCAIGPERTAHVIDRSRIPHGLLDPSPTAPPGTAPTENVTLYFESAQGLVAVARAARRPVTLRAVVRLLARGPTVSERSAGVQSPLSTGRPITLRSLVNDVATVDLPADVTDLGGQDQIVAVAQLVYTITAYPGVDAVTVLVNGIPATVPTANGSLSAGPLRRADYAELAPR